MAAFKTLEDLARSLGAQIAGHERTKNYFSAQKAVQSDGEARRIMQEYQKHVEHVQRLDIEQKPIEVADKQRLVDLEARVAGHASLKSLMQAQADYMELMTRVHQAMEEPLMTAAGVDIGRPAEARS